MPTVEVPGLGDVEFPDSMSNSDIEGAIANHFKSAGPVAEKLPQFSSISLSPYQQARLDGTMPANFGPMGPANPQEVLALPQLLQIPAAAIEQTGIMQSGDEAAADFLRRTGIDPSAQAGQSLVPPLPENSSIPGIGRGIDETLRGFLTPGGAAALPFLGLKPVQLGFRSQMASGVPGAIQGAINAKDASERTQALLQAGLGALAGVHGGEAEPIEPDREPINANDQIQSPSGIPVKQQSVPANVVPEEQTKVGTPQRGGEGEQALPPTEVQPGKVGAEAPESEPTKLPPSASFGGALPEEVEERGTSLKNAVADMERLGLGLDDAPETVQKNMAEAWDKSGQIPPEVGAKLASELIADPEMGLTDDQSALLLRHKVKLFNDLNDAAERSHSPDAAIADAAKADHANLLTDYRNLLDAVKERGSQWGREGRWRQAMVKEDFSFESRGDINQYHRNLHGNDLTPAQEVAADKVAKVVKTASDADKQSTKTANEVVKEAADKVVRDETDKATKQEPLTEQQKATRDALKAAEQAVKRAEDQKTKAGEAAKNAKTKSEKDAADEQVKAARRAFDAANKTVRENAIRIANEDTKSRVADEVRRQETLKVQETADKEARRAADKAVKQAVDERLKAEERARMAKTKSEKDAAKVQLKAAQKAVDTADKAHRKATLDLIKTQNKLQGNPILRVWTKVKELMDKDQNMSFDDVANKAAIELGMSIKNVKRTMAQNDRVKKAMDDAWASQQRLGRLKDEARRWVAGAETPELNKLISGLPRILFGLKTFGHGTVALGTHAPAVAFMPQYWSKYFPAYKTMYKMTGILKPTPKGFEAAKAFYQDQVNRLQGGKNFIRARRAGLQNDPSVFEDYTDPKITKFITGGEIGQRGFTVLKILRQDMFDKQWENLPRSLQTDEMAKQLANDINHVTGVTKAMTPKGLGTALFAPRLLASRFATLVGDPTKAGITFLKAAKGDYVSPEDWHFAVSQVQSKAVMAATGWALLNANNELLKATGSKQRVNFTDPFKSDWLKFKAYGKDFAYGNAMLSMARMPFEIGYRLLSQGDINRLAAKLPKPVGNALKGLSAQSKQRGCPDETIARDLWKFGRSQMSPYAGLATDLLLGADYAERPLPRKLFGLVEQTQPVPKRLKAQGLKPYTWGEYGLEQGSPIPGQEAAKEVWSEYAKHGWNLSAWDKKHLAEAVGTIAVMAGTGGRISDDYNLKK